MAVNTQKSTSKKGTWRSWIRGRLSGRTIIHRLGLLGFLLLVFSPLLVLVAGFTRSILHQDTAYLSLMLPSERRLGLLFNSLGLAIGVAVSGVLVGFLAAGMLWRWRRAPGAWLRWCFLLLVPIPPYAHAIAWDSLLVPLNAFLQRSGFSAIPFQGWIGTWWVQLMAWLPVAVGLALVGLESVEMRMIEAARMLRSDRTILFRIVIPIAAPILVASGGFLFLLSLMDYSIPSYFGLNVYALEIFAEFSASNEPLHTFVLSLPMLLVTVLLISISQQGFRNADQTPAASRKVWVMRPSLPLWLRTLQRLALGMLIGQGVVLVVSLAAAAGSLTNILAVSVSAGREISNTFWIALGAALLSLPFAFAAANELVNNERYARLWWFLVTIPLALPPPLVGVGLIAIWNRPVFAGVYGSLLMPILASAARFASLAVVIMTTQLRRIDPLLVDAARLIETKPRHTTLLIRLPLLVPGLASAACISFALSLGELGATLMVVPAGMSSLTIRIYNYLHYGATSEVAGLCLLMSLLALISASLAWLAMFGWRKLVLCD
ncbi:MAG: ABC transporter permease subunit [Anaerolineaceae bacterium]|nr:ABC transporter permease subunit [Anaerolineaceae bacterium]